MRCNKCGGSFQRMGSAFPGWDLLACVKCGRPIRLLRQTEPKRTKSRQRGLEKRAERAARRSGLIE